VVIVAALLPALVGCGPSGGGASGGGAGEAPVHAVSSPRSVALVALDDTTFAVVDGTATTDGEVRAVLRVGDFDRDVTTYELPTPPLLFPHVWVDGGAIRVVGTACDRPQVDRLADARTPDQACDHLGGSTLVQVDPSTGASRVVATDLPANRHGDLTVVAGPALTALVAYRPGTPPPGELDVHLLDPVTGETAVLGTAPGTDLFCAGPQGIVGPAASAGALTLGPDAGQDAAIRAVVITEAGVRSVPVPPPPLGLAMPLPAGCTSDGAVAFAGEGEGSGFVALGLDADGSPVWEQVPYPAPPGEEAAAPVPAPGGVVAWVPSGDGTSFTAWQPLVLDGDRWRALDPIDSAEQPSQVVLAGGHLLSVVTTGSGTTLVRR